MKHRCIVFMIGVLLAGAGNAKDLATVNDMVITDTDYNTFANQHNAKHYGKASARERFFVLQTMINRELLAQKAQSEGVSQSAQFKQQFEQNKSRASNIEQLKKDLLVNVYIQQLSQQPQFSDKALKKAYESGVPKKEYYMHHILVDSKDKADMVLGRLKKGEAFDKVAKSVSQDISARHGGVVGWVSAPALPEPVSEALQKLNSPYTKEPVASDYGWHIIRVTDKRKLAAAPFKEKKASLKREKFSAYMQSHLAELREKANVNIKEH